jgi:penicillin amidase
LKALAGIPVAENGTAAQNCAMLKTFLAAVVLALLLVVGFRPVGPAPALGPLLDPAHGAWALARVAELPRRDSATVPGLAGRVEVRYDDRGVPHVFAARLEDAWRALGFVVARDRLFQLELQTRAGVGTLTELAGAGALPLDRETRELGLDAYARAAWARLPDSALARRAAVAFADGVNAYASRMTAAELPLEYRLAGATPQRWEPWHTAALFARMGYTLAWNDDELWRERVRALVGPTATAALYPKDAPLQEPIEPNGAGAPVERVVRVPAPGARDSTRLVALRGLDLPSGRRDWTDALGSNNWAVAPSRSASGHALLSGDPHLELSLPSIWYETHLVVPDTLDAYGVTFPGAPTVVIGFNRDAAWTFTNTESDVLDRWVETVDDERAPTRYQVDGAWRALRLEPTTYRDKTGRAIATDTIRWTHRGPMQRVGGRWISLRWTVLEAGTELGAFIAIDRVKDARDFMSAMNGFQAPAQNMLVADRGGHIAIRSTGRFPIRADNAGDALRDGGTSSTDWRGDLPLDRYPQAFDPAQGFLASANQQPRDPARDPFYFGANWYAPWRAMRINALLRADSSVTPDDMRRFQTDPGSARADAFVPLLLDGARRARLAGRGDAAVDTAARLLAEWDRRYTRDNRRAVLFEAVMRELRDRLWDELIPDDTANRADRVPLPTDMMVMALVRDSANAWWDDLRTRDGRETRDDILAAAIAGGYRAVRARYGDPQGDGWRWDRIRFTNIRHSLGLPALSALEIPVQGGPSTLAPSEGSGRHGASWRMVVEMAETPRAWTIYPGGQSGNPASRFYKDRVGPWSRGELQEALVPRTAAELPIARTISTLVLTPAAEARR